jgi:phage baseplate assembly protein gpV
MKISERSHYVKTFLYGQRAQKFTNKRIVFTPSDYILDALPKQKLYGKAMRSYESDGNRERVIYEDGTSVEVDVEADQYRVALGNGMVIARDYTSFVPLSERSCLACSREGGIFSYPVPEGWTEEEKIIVHKLNSDGTRMKVDVRIANGNIEFSSEPGAPYKVSY